MPSGQAAERMNISTQRDVVLLHVMTFHSAEGIVGAVFTRAVEVGEVFEMRWMPIDAISAEDQTAGAGRPGLNSI